MTPTDDDNDDGKPNRRSCRFTKTLSLSLIIAMTGSFFLVELIVGHLTKSNSLVADAFHMLSDLISLIIGITAVRFSKLKSSNKNSFGWARAEILGSLVNSVFLLALCFTIIVEAINRYLTPEPLEHVELMLAVGGGGLLLNIISLIIFALQQCQEHREADTLAAKTGAKTKKRSTNLNMHGVFLNALGDSLGSVAVMISGLLVKFAPPANDSTATWKLYIDPTLSLIIATIITVSTVPLLKRSSLILLQTVPPDCDIEKIRGLLRNVNGVVDVHHFHIWSLNTDRLIASAHIRVGDRNDEEDWNTIAEVKRLLHQNNIHSTTIQLEHDEASLNSCHSAECIERPIKSAKEIELIERQTKETDKANDDEIEVMIEPKDK